MMPTQAATRLNDGFESLARWWRSGKDPVPITEATDRADICEGCPYNEHESLFEQATSLATKIVREGMAWKLSRSLTVPNEEKLHICSVCGCDLKLKVFAPIEIAKVPRRDYPNHCWIKHDIQGR